MSETKESQSVSPILTNVPTREKADSVEGPFPAAAAAEDVECGVCEEELGVNQVKS